MCFAADDTISFFIVRIALCLSIMILGTILIRSSSSRICLIHPHLDTLFAPAMNSASIVDIAKTACFFELNAIGRSFSAVDSINNPISIGPNVDLEVFN